MVVIVEPARKPHLSPFPGCYRQVSDAGVQNTYRRPLPAGTPVIQKRKEYEHQIRLCPVCMALLFPGGRVEARWGSVLEAREPPEVGREQNESSTDGAQSS